MMMIANEVDTDDDFELNYVLMIGKMMLMIIMYACHNSESLLKL
jgi:hypothetical protein